MGRLNLGVALGLCLLLFLSCAKAPIGNKVDMQKLDWCSISRLPHTCVYRSDQAPFYLKLVLSAGETQGEFLAEGTCDFAKGRGKAAGPGRAVVADVLLIIANKGKIIDSVAFKLEANDASQDVPFTVKFHSQNGFDAATFYVDISPK